MRSAETATPALVKSAGVNAEHIALPEDGAITIGGDCAEQQTAVVTMAVNNMGLMASFIRGESSLGIGEALWLSWNADSIAEPHSETC